MRWKAGKHHRKISRPEAASLSRYTVSLVPCAGHCPGPAATPFREVDTDTVASALRETGTMNDGGTL